MAKNFYTERDIENLAASGEFTLNIGEDIVLTDLAQEKAQRLGIKLIQPYEGQPTKPGSPQHLEKSNTNLSAADAALKFDDRLRQRIHIAVQAKFGDAFDSHLLDTIITRVLNNIGGG